MGWSENSGTRVVSNIIPNGNFPSHHAIFGRGGYKTVANEAERLAIPIDRLTIGSVVRQHDTGVEWVVTKLPGNINSDSHTGNDCTWEPIKSGGLDIEALETLKGQPNGLASLDEEGKVPESQTRTIIFRGTYVNENEFKSVNGTPHVGRENAIYIDNTNGKMYSFTGGKFVRDSIYWNVIS